LYIYHENERQKGLDELPLLNKTLTQKKKRIPFLEESDRLPFFVFIHGILFIIMYSFFVNFVLPRTFDEAGGGFGSIRFDFV
jgi:hypothetical protein